MDLQFDDGSTLALDPGQPVSYDGGVSVIGSLRNGPVRNFNVMVAPNTFEATLEIIHGSNERRVQTCSGDVLLIHMLDGQCSVVSNNKKMEALSVNTSLLVEGENTIFINFASGPRGAIVQLQKPSRATTHR